MKHQVIQIYKPIGVTPLQSIQKFKLENPEYKEEKISYAGRLDPMAHGQMLLLIGEENRNREKYLNLDKTYKFTVMFGIQTDSFDFLGILKNLEYKKTPVNLEDLINKFIQKNIGKYSQEYPPFATKTVNGKPLFKWAREEKLHEIKMPTKEIQIYSFELKNISTISKKDLQNYIFENVNKLEGDFRQPEILQEWEKFFNENNVDSFPTAHFQVRCSSGTYVRSLANNLGNFLKCGAITIDIEKTQIG